MNLDQLRASRDFDRARVDQIKAEMRDEEKLYRLGEIRKERRLTQTELAEALGVVRSRIPTLEGRDPGATTIATLLRYLDALGMDMEITATSRDGTGSYRLTSDHAPVHHQA